MDHLQHLRQHIRRYLFIYLLADNALLIGIWWLGITQARFSSDFLAIMTIIVAICIALCIVILNTSYVIQPVQALWQVILHLSPTQHDIAAPKLDELKVGRELVSSLATQIYQLIDVAQQSAAPEKAVGSDLKHNFIAQNLPLPLFILDSTETIIYANEAASRYINMAVDDLIGKNVYMVLDMSFPSEDTLDKWLKMAKSNKATAQNSWERVRLDIRDNHPTLLFDLACYYNRENANHFETMLVLFDHTKQYSQDDQAIGFIALSVHELRTPLTILRGYIEVLEDELTGQLDPELQDFLLKMKSTTQQLTAFVNNILNVARVDNDQLELQLQQADWSSILTTMLEALKLRASVQGITIDCRIAPNLPPVGVDSLSIGEVITNLVDNAIKYSGTSKSIIIETHLTNGGLVETTVQDFGVGISTSILSNLFTKFYRDHRNRAQIGGTGLGLYLSKAIVTAHGGNLWVRSKEGQGSIFGFTLLPYAQLTEERKQSGNQEIIRSAHGWIKNHSLYRK